MLRFRVTCKSYFWSQYISPRIYIYICMYDNTLLDECIIKRIKIKKKKEDINSVK
jgi:hypothetical protein